MINITIPPESLGQVDMAKRQHVYALARALTKTGVRVNGAEVELMKESFDRPTPYTLKSLFLKPATKKTLAAHVWVKDDRAGSGTPATKYVLPNIVGGKRNVKRFEVALQRAGHLPAGWITVAGQGARLDQYGNVSSGQIIQILSQLRLRLTEGYSRDMARGRKGIAAQRRAGGRFFVIPPGGSTQPGVYQREFMGRNITPVMIFAQQSQTHYRQSLPFETVANRTVNRHFAAELQAAIEHANATALLSDRDQVSLF